jgi:hypothetical protein
MTKDICVSYKGLRVAIVMNTDDVYNSLALSESELSP